MRVGSAIVPVFCLLVGCAYQTATPDTPPPDASLAVPSNEWPDPGECRIWIPGVPASEQRPAGPCPTLSGQLPSGAWLVHRERDRQRYVKVAVYHPERPGLLMAIHVYDARTGAYVRNEAPQ